MIRLAPLVLPLLLGACAELRVRAAPEQMLPECPAADLTVHEPCRPPAP
jgi:hypothetical protein